MLLMLVAISMLLGACGKEDLTINVTADKTTLKVTQDPTFKIQPSDYLEPA